MPCICSGILHVERPLLQFVFPTRTALSNQYGWTAKRVQHSPIKLKHLDTLERPVSERIAELEKIPIAEPDVDLEEDFTQREEAVKHDRSETEDETDTDTSHRLRRSILTPVNATILRGKRGMVPGDTFFGVSSLGSISAYSA